MNRKYGEEKVQIERLLKVHEQIRSGIYPNAKTLAKDLEVSERTILRDIEYLRDRQNAPVEFDRKRNGYYYTKPAYFLQSVLLSEEELQILIDMGILVGYSYDDQKESNIVKNTFRKILTVLPEEKTLNMPFTPSKNENYTHIFEPIVRMSRYYIDTLEECVKNKEIVEIDYWKSSNQKYKIYTIKPLHLFNEENKFYLLALNKNNKPGIYSINRIRKLNKTNASFEIPKNIKISDFLKKNADVSPSDNTIFNFEFLFPKEIANDAIEKYYYFNQIIELQKDGSVIVKFRTTKLHDVFRWVLGQGHKVKVLNPPELVTMVKKELKILSQYYKE